MERPQSVSDAQEAAGAQTTTRYLIALDTSNEVIALAIGELACAEGETRDGVEDCAARSVRAAHALPAVRAVRTAEIPAHRASNTQLLPQLEALIEEAGVARRDIACVAVGRGPGSFTGVRIAMATAKGIASALGVGLVGLSTADVVAWGAWAAGVRGGLAVAADAMRHEVYPVRFCVDDAGIERLDADSVERAEEAASRLREDYVSGDALAKYADLFAECGDMLPQELWTPRGEGLLLAFEAAWRAGEIDPFDKRRHNPAFVLPVYTRLSDAEENERKRLALSDATARNLRTGVQGGEANYDKSVAEAYEAAEFATEAANEAANASASAQGKERVLVYQPLDRMHAADVATMESQVMGSDAWNEGMIVEELPQRNRVWWMCVEEDSDPLADIDGERRLLGYAGALIVDGDAQILKVAVDPAYRRRGIARELLARIADDARNLAATSWSLEVRESNENACAFYEALGMQLVGIRPRYYSDGENAAIYQGVLGETDRLALGGELASETIEAASTDSGESDLARQSRADSSPRKRPEGTFIFAIESSCDETAAAIIDGEGTILASTVASSVDFHARFGGVVPEIASRKHIEAICGVCEECLEAASLAYDPKGEVRMSWEDMDAIAATYAPGLVGALVVGVAFAKGAAWALDRPYIGVNHLEGHLYANKIGISPDEPPFEPPAIVSLVSGGNTMLVHMRDWGDYETLGATIDDAVGEAFDKVAKAMGMGYPGGPVISRLAAQGDPKAIPFPRAMLHSGDLRFSLSGLKTAVITYMEQERDAGRELDLPDVAASFQQAVIDVQIAKAKTALRDTGAPTFCLGGGVAANPALRAAYEKMCRKMKVRLIMPPLAACGDNAAMIALVALDRFREGKFFALDSDAYAHTNLDEPY